MSRNTLNIKKTRKKRMNDKAMKGVASPEIVGPGIWFTIHTLAFEANTLLGMQNFCKTVRTIISNMKCSKCKDHAQKHIKELPPERYFFVTRDGKNFGMFKWSWEFHNIVNKMLGKPLMTLEDAIKLFESSEVCTNCGNQQDSIVNMRIKPEIITPPKTRMIPSRRIISRRKI